MATTRRRTRSAFLFLLPAAVILGLFVVYPIGWCLMASFREIGIADLTGLRPWSLPGKFDGLGQYRQVVAEGYFWQSVKNTLYFAVLFIPGTLGVSLGMALLVHRDLRGVGGFRAIFFLPYVVSIVAAGWAWRTMFDTHHGLTNGLLALVGVTGPDWLNHPHLAMPVIAMMSIWRWSGYFMLIFLAGLQAIPKELYEAAMVDGAGAWARFRHISLPLLRRPMIFALTVLLIRAQNVFQEVYVITGGGPFNRTVTVAYAIWKTGIAEKRIGPAAAMSHLLFLMVLAVAVIQFVLLWRRGET